MAAGLLLVVFSGCVQAPRKGIIIAKRYEPAHTQTTVVPVTGGRSASSVPYTYVIPENYWLTVRLAKSGEEETVSVSAAEFARSKVGDSYVVP
jgi:hypothetical protein